MDSIATILARAKERAAQLKVTYAGALLPAEAHALLKADPSAKLVDVRTKAELEWVGQVPGAISVEWNTWPGGRNPDFLKQLEAAIPAKDAPVMFLCRSGGRSNSTASVAAGAGYVKSFNILEGFEGDKDADGHRNTVGGWRKAGLPWTQG